MGPHKNVRQLILFSLMILGYLETLRRATFFAFGWAGAGQAPGIISLIVVVYVFMDNFQPSRLRKALLMTVAFLYLTALWQFNRIQSPADYSFIGETFFGLPDFGLGTVSRFYYATFCLLAILFYALIVFLVTSFIIEKKSLTEMFTAGIILMVVEITVSSQEIMAYMVLNLVFTIGLRSQLYLFRLESDYRARHVKGSGLSAGIWAGVSLAVVILVLLIASAFPAGESKIDLMSGSSKLVKKVTDSGQTTAARGSPSYDLFWGKLQSFELSGEVTLDDRPVMYVKSPVPSYWRGESADYYTGSGWENSLRPVITDGRSIASPFARTVTVQEVEQVFLLAPEVSSEVIFSSGAPASVNIPGGRLTADEGGNFYSAATKPGVTYKVVSYIPERDIEKLKRTSAEYPFEIRRHYLQLPDSVPYRVRQLAEKLTRHTGSPYEKTKIIERFLSDNYSYDLMVSPTPQGRDVADYFLFDLKKGYCTYHSTAMVVMLRSIGIPARWVKGFMMGSLNPDLDVYEVNLKDAHAWVEVYFSGYGWLPFEPTSSFVIPGELPGNSDSPVLDVTSDVSEDSSIATPADSQRALPSDPVSPLDILNEPEYDIPWGALTAVILIGGSGGYYLWLNRRVSESGTGDRMRDTYLSFIDFLARKGHPRETNQTPLEFAKTLKHSFPEDYPAILRITEAYLAEKYGTNRLSRDDIEEVRVLWRELAGKWLGKAMD